MHSPALFLGAFLLPSTGRHRTGAVATRAALLTLLVWGHGRARTHPGPAQSWQTVQDQMGRTLRVRIPARRVVALAPSAADTLFALGACRQVVAISAYADCPAAVAPCRTVGQPLSPSLEMIAALQPDLVVAARTANRRETVSALERMGVPVYVTDEHSVGDIARTVRTLGALLGRQKAAAELALRMQQHLEAIQTRLARRPPRRVLFVVWMDPLITAGPHTFITDALRFAGAIPAVAVGGDWPHLSLEQVVVAQPEYLIFPAATPGSAKPLLDELRRRAGWKDLQAVQQGRIVLVGESFNRPSPQLIGQIESLARALHPQAFADLPQVSAAEEAPCGH
jgi:iron complex transport system substrate-binding protein